MLKKLIAAIMTLLLVGHNIALANPAVRNGTDDDPLIQIQAQAQQDLASLHSNYQMDTKEILSNIVVAMSWGFAGINFYEHESTQELYEKLLANRREADPMESALRDLYIKYLDTTGERPFVVTYEIFRAEFADRNLRYLNESADEIAQAITKRTWDEMQAADKDLLVWLTSQSEQDTFVGFVPTNERSLFKDLEKIAERENQSLQKRFFEDFKLWPREHHKLVGSFGYEIKIKERLTDYGWTQIYETIKAIEAVKSHLPRLHKLSLSYPAKSIERRVFHAVAKDLAKKLGLLGLGTVLILGLSGLSEQQASAHNLAWAKRIAANPMIFLQADPQLLQQIENDEMANKVAREIAQTLHQATMSNPEDMDSFIKMNQSLQKETQHKLVHSLRTVVAR